MDVFIYFYERLTVGLDELEDALENVLGNDGEVTGAGRGEFGSNLDVFVNDPAMTDESIVALIKQALAEFTIPKSSKIVIGEKTFSIV